MGEVVATEPDNLLVTTVGSCVAVCLYDSIKKTGGMAHILLPKSRNLEKQTHPNKFADIAVPELLSMMINKGSRKGNLKAKIAGGASMFPQIDRKVLNIGEENIRSVKQSLSECGLVLLGEDVGGEKGRKIEFELPSGKLSIDRLNGEKMVL